MKIGHQTDNANARQPKPAGRDASRADAAAKLTSGKEQAEGVAQHAGVAVSLSSPPGRTGATGAASGDFNADKVRAVRQAIENGSFKVDAQAVATRLLDSAAEALSRARG